MDGKIRIDAELERDGIRTPFQLTISEPCDSTEGDAYCVVHAPTLIGGDRKIFGIDRQQARELAFAFVQKLIEPGRIVGPDGQQIVLSDESSK